VWKLNAVENSEAWNEHLICLSLGSNILPEANLPCAVGLLRQVFKVKAVSMAWETPAIGTSGPNFLNAAVLAYTQFASEKIIKSILLQIETQLGRIRSEDKFAPRPIDIDILIFDTNVIEPHLWKLAHLAIPVAEVLPDLETAGNEESLVQIAKELADTTGILPRPDVLPGMKSL
jgi:2-amino-4-hydroxy-6-hydroxymethyldihydropteridine diphosphokinase